MHDQRLIGELRRLRHSGPPEVDVVDRVLAELPRLRLEPRRLLQRRPLWLIAAAAVSGALFSLGGLWKAAWRAAPPSEEALVVAGGLGDAVAGVLSPLGALLEALPSALESLERAAAGLVDTYGPLMVAFAVTGALAATATVVLVVARDFTKATREDMP